MVFYVDLFFTALVTNEHLFTCLLVINIFSVASIYFSHLSIYCCISWVLYIFWTQGLWWMHVSWIFFPRIWLAFFILQPLDEELVSMLSNFWSLLLSLVFFLCFSVSSVLSTISLLNPRLQRHSHIFFQKFYSRFDLMSRTHLKCSISNYFLWRMRKS